MKKIQFEDIPKKNGINIEIIKFLFPLYPIKVFRSTKFMAIIGILLALRIAFNFFAIPIPGMTQTISFSWVPVMVMGWFFGPILGFFFGWVTDTLCYLIFPPGLWFWMFAIQESCVGVLSGVFAGIMRYRTTHKTSINIDILIQQIIYWSFAIICYISLIAWLTPDKKLSTLDQNMNTVYKYTALVLLSVFMCIMEYVTIYHIKNNKENPIHLLIFIYATCLVVLLMEIFSFLLGPIAALEYYKYLNGKEPAGYIKYGTLFYLIPRVIVQCIKTPLESFLMGGIVLALNPSFNNTLNHLKNMWESPN